jgi:RimJ/RimL family protein N-acetyltransferase
MSVASGVRFPSIFGVPSGIADPQNGIILKKPQESDALKVMIALNRNLENISRFFDNFSPESPFSLEHAKRYCINLAEETWREHYFIYTHSGEFVGQGSLVPADDISDHIQVSLWVDEKLQGRGFGKLIVQQLVHLAFDEQHDYSVFFYRHDTGNVASSKIPEKLGFYVHCEFEEDANTPLETGKTLCWAFHNPKHLEQLYQLMIESGEIIPKNDAL